jgi:hypothetical protein
MLCYAMLCYSILFYPILSYPIYLYLWFRVCSCCFEVCAANGQNVVLGFCALWLENGLSSECAIASSYITPNQATSQFPKLTFLSCQYLAAAPSMRSAEEVEDAHQSRQTGFWANIQWFSMIWHIRWFGSLAPCKTTMNWHRTVPSRGLSLSSIVDVCGTIP